MIWQNTVPNPKISGDGFPEYQELIGYEDTLLQKGIDPYFEHIFPI